ncbi:MAG: UbiA family prenyltransferase, partial [Chthoniobacterales bacterium]
MKDGRIASESGLTRFLRLIRFSHTIFALPFALGALLVATHGRPSGRLLALVLLCMVCARTAAMLFNRIVDWSLDQRNPRTASRHEL